MNVEALARQSYAKYQDTLAGIPAADKPSAVRRTRMLLGGDNKKTEVSEQMFINAFTRMAPYIEEPTRLFPKAKAAIYRALEGRNNHLSKEEVDMLAAFLCAHDIRLLRSIPEDLGINWENYSTKTFFNLPNPWYLHFPRYDSPFHPWSRIGDSYIQPQEMSLEEKIMDLTAKGTPVSILDGGAGDAAYLETLKARFDDSVRTFAVDLSNQNLPVDESVIGPMEALPNIWTDKFDVVISNYALCYSFFPVKAIQELLRVLKPERDAYLDIASSIAHVPFEELKIMRELLGKRNISFNTYYARLGSFEEIKSLIEGWSDGKTVYEVRPARKGESNNHCVQITKHRVN